MPESLIGSVQEGKLQELKGPDPELVQTSIVWVTCRLAKGVSGRKESLQGIQHSEEPDELFRVFHGGDAKSDGAERSKGKFELNIRRNFLAKSEISAAVEQPPHGSGGSLGV